MASPFRDSVILGIIQGLTEFLPVSSSGHVALAQLLFGMAGGGIALNVMLHAGTLLATVALLRRRVASAVIEGAGALRHPHRFTDTPGGRDALVVLLASIPTGAMGLLLRQKVEQWAGSPLALGLGFLTTTGLLLSTRWIKLGERESLGIRGALLLGLVQGVAVMPGVSRSGSTIATALWLKVRPDRAFELSMLLSLPVIVGAVLLELPKLDSAGLGAAAVGAAVACGVGLLALLFLRRAVIGGHFASFSMWTLPLAIATLAMARAWPG